MDTDKPPAKDLRTTDDVTDAVLKAAEECWEGWFSNEDRIDWEDFLDRLADPYGHGEAGAFDFDEYDNPAIRKIQRHIRKYIREG